MKLMNHDLGKHGVKTPRKSEISHVFFSFASSIELGRRLASRARKVAIFGNQKLNRDPK